MPLSAGARLGPYQVLEFVGAGGMGEVYRARDTRLDRVVAIKLLPESVSGDESLRRRFDREAKILASLKHAHICTLYDVGRQDTTDYLAMEYLQGETLVDKVGHGPLPLELALEWAIQIAEALDAAHRAGVVHRDLKPGNIIVTASGPTLLDFGLAKKGSPLHTTLGEMQTAASAPETARGSIMGTFRYMSPEQVEGKEADARSDIFAFGAVLIEMLTGRRAFVADSTAQLLGAILRDDPTPPSSLQPRVPPSLDRLVRKCVAKDPDARWQTARDLRDELAWIATERTPTVVNTNLAASPRREYAGWLAAALVLVAVAGAWVLLPRGSEATAHDVMRLEIAPPKGMGLVSFALSPNGRMLAYQATVDGRSQIWLRPLDAERARPLEGTEDATIDAPFWSPDSQSLGFSTTHGTLKRVDLANGQVRTLVAAGAARGASWGADGTIVFAKGSSSALSAVAATGGSVTEITDLQRPAQTGHRFPHFLPGSRAFSSTSSGRPKAAASTLAVWIRNRASG